MAPYALFEREVSELWDRFGPRRAFRPQYPFWRMREDQVWEIDRPNLVAVYSSKDASPKSLRDQDIHGGLLEDDYMTLRNNPWLAWRVADSLVDAHFPESYRDDILQATGIDRAMDWVAGSQAEGQLGEERAAYELEFESVRRLKRDPVFRPAVLDAYREQCAVCAFDVRLAGKSTAVEAAHIHWHADAGPARVRNGLALCNLHHRLFDRGAFTLSADDLTMLVSKDAVGTGFDEALGRFEGLPPQVLPLNDHDLPAARYLRWHHGEVFRGNSRAL